MNLNVLSFYYLNFVHSNYACDLAQLKNLK